VWAKRDKVFKPYQEEVKLPERPEIDPEGAKRVRELINSTFKK